MSVAVVGAGISGVACARALRAAGVDVIVHERSRTVGGRMASPLLHDRRVDTGAAYFTVDSAEFATVAADWQRRGLATVWTDTLAVHSLDGLRASSGPQRWRAPGGLRSLVADPADGLDVRLGSAVDRVGPGARVDGVATAAVVLAMPDPQAVAVLDPAVGALFDELRERVWRPVISVAVGAAARTWPALTAMFVNDHPVLSLVVDDGARRGDRAPVLLAHTSTELAARHLADPDAVVADVITALTQVLDTELQVQWTHAHRWSYARPAEPRELPYHLGESLIGLCGDGWGTPKVESAWRSGTALGAAIATRLAR